MNKRVLMFGWEFPPHFTGGLGVACYGLTRAMAQEDMDITFVVPKKLEAGAPWVKMVFADESSEGIMIAGRAVDIALAPYVTQEGYREWRQKLKQGITLPYAADLFAEVLRYASLGGVIASEEQFDIIYAHDWLSMGAGIEAKRVSKKPLIVQVHATEFDRCGGCNGINGAIYEVERAGMEAADKVVAVSDLTRRSIIENYGIPSEKISVVHNGIDDITMEVHDGVSPKLQSLKAAGNKIVLFLGRLTAQKGPDQFLQAAKKVLDHNRAIYFVIAGTGDMDAHMRASVKELGIDDRVIFTGFVNRVDASLTFAAADLYVMPSVSEPFGIVALEAMVHGTPVIMSKQSGVSEIAQHALKVDFWDIDEMANKILSVVGYPGLGATLSQNASKEVQSITWRAAGKKIRVIVDNLTPAV